jgi:hypothetical protein
MNWWLLGLNYESRVLIICCYLFLMSFTFSRAFCAPVHLCISSHEGGCKNSKTLRNDCGSISMKSRLAVVQGWHGANCSCLAWASSLVANKRGFFNQLFLLTLLSSYFSETSSGSMLVEHSERFRFWIEHTISTICTPLYSCDLQFAHLFSCLLCPCPLICVLLLEYMYMWPMRLGPWGPCMLHYIATLLGLAQYRKFTSNTSHEGMTSKNSRTLRNDRGSISKKSSRAGTPWSKLWLLSLGFICPCPDSPSAHPASYFSETSGGSMLVAHSRFQIWIEHTISTRPCK